VLLSIVSSGGGFTSSAYLPAACRLHYTDTLTVAPTKMANCGAFLVQFLAVQLVALHAKSSAYERIEQKRQQNKAIGNYIGL